MPKGTVASLLTAINEAIIDIAALGVSKLSEADYFDGNGYQCYRPNVIALMELGAYFDLADIR